MCLRNFKMFHWSDRVLDSLLLLLLVLPWAQGAVLRCDSTNRDPCARFPDLCSEGGGLCVIKGPCEYECVCPPDGRRGRDCSKNDGASNQPKETDSSSGKDGGHVESLLVFPQNLFWDLNHAQEHFEFVKITSTPRSSAENMKSTPSTSASGSSNPVLKTASDRSQTKVNYLRRVSVSTRGPSSLTTVITTLLPHEEISSTVPQTTPSTPPVAPTIPPDFLHARSPDSPSKPEESPSNTKTVDVDQPNSKMNKVSIPRNNGGSQNLTSHQKAAAMLSQTFMLSTANLNEATVATTPPQETSTSTPERQPQEAFIPFIDKEKTNTNHPSNILNDGPPSTPHPVHPDIGDRLSSSSVRSRSFPGHEMFPTFFREQMKGSPSENEDTPNAPLTFLVQRVYHRPEAFPILRRGND